MIARVIASSSKGNAVLYHDSVLVDIGVSYTKLKEYVGGIKLILLTHSHKDHLNLTTLKRIMKETDVKVCCCKWMLDHLQGIDKSRIHVFKPNIIYSFGVIQVSPFILYHDVENCGWRIFNNGFKIFHATDTHTLEGLTAKNYDLFALEGNYCEEVAQREIAHSQATGEFTRIYLSMDSHLSKQQAEAFFEQNRKETSRFIRLHVSDTYG